MAKDPRFNFYPDNFEGGTDGFTLEQDGAYLRLLILQFRRGTFTEEQALDKLSMHCRGNAVAYAALWKFLMPKFIPENFDGVNYYNDRLALEVDKSKKTSERQAVTAKSRWEKEKNGNATAYPTASATGDAFSSKSSIVIKESIVDKEKKERTTVKEKSTEVSENVLEIISYLNELNGTRFRSDTKATNRLIEQRIKEGFPVTELKEIIEYKVGEWKGTDREKWLQPDTLFAADNCAKYRNQVQAAKDKNMTLTQIKGTNGGKTKPTMEGILNIIYKNQPVQ